MERKAYEVLLVFLRAWLAHRRSGWMRKEFDVYISTEESFYFDDLSDTGLCIYVERCALIFAGFSSSEAEKAQSLLHDLLMRDFGSAYRPFGEWWDGPLNLERVAWVRKIVKELEKKS